jgi:hypothetical protein
MLAYGLAIVQVRSSKKGCRELYTACLVYNNIKHIYASTESEKREEGKR